MSKFYKGPQQQRSAGPQVSAGSTDMTISGENQQRLAKLKSSINSLQGIANTGIALGVKAENAETAKVKSANSLAAKDKLSGITTEVNKQIQLSQGDSFRLKTVAEQKVIYDEAFKKAVESRRDPNNAEFNAILDNQGLEMQAHSFNAVAKHNQNLLEKDTKANMTNAASASFTKNGYDVKATMAELEESLAQTKDVVGTKAAKESAVAGFIQLAMSDTKAYEGLIASGELDNFPESAKTKKILKNANDARYQKEQTMAYQSAKAQVGVLNNDPSILSIQDATSRVNAIVKANGITDKNKILTLNASVVKQFKNVDEAQTVLTGLKNTSDAKGTLHSMKPEVDKEFFRLAAGKSEDALSMGSLGVNPDGGMTDDLTRILDYNKTYNKLPKAFIDYARTPINNGNAADLSNKLGIVSSGLQYNSDAIHQAFPSKDLNKLQLYGLLLHDESVMKANSDEADPKLVKERMDEYDRVVEGDFNGHTSLSKVNAYLKKSGKNIDLGKTYKANAETSFTLGNDIGVARNMQLQYTFQLQAQTKGATLEEAIKTSKSYFKANYPVAEFANGEQTMLDYKWAPNVRDNLVDYMKAMKVENPEDYTLINSADTLLTNGETATIRLNGNNLETIKLSDFHDKIRIYREGLSIKASKEAEAKRAWINKYKTNVINALKLQQEFGI